MSLVDELIAPYLPRLKFASYSETEEILRALVSAALEVRGVPREPTKEMLIAALAVWNGPLRGANEYNAACWQAMLDAAPAIPKGEAEWAEWFLRQRLADAPPELLAMAQRIADTPDTRTEEQIIADGVKFVMGPGGDEGTRRAAGDAVPVAPDWADVLTKPCLGNSSRKHEWESRTPTHIQCRWCHAVLTVTPAAPAKGDTPSVVRPVAHELDSLLPEICQLIDSIKAEWKLQGAWSEWDESVRERIAQYNMRRMAALAPAGEPK